MVDLDLPETILSTVAVWYTVDDLVIHKARLTAADLPGSLHAAEHAAIGMLPLFAMADRWDIGGVSTAFSADTSLPTVFIYDGYPGGAGIAARGYRRGGRAPGGDAGGGVPVPVRERLPVMRPVAQMRKR